MGEPFVYRRLARKICGTGGKMFSLKAHVLEETIVFEEARCGMDI
jgi:hypothetical protein